MRRFLHPALPVVVLIAFATPVGAQPPFVSLKSRLERLQHPDPEARRDAVGELALLGADPPVVVPALLAALHDPEPAVQLAAATALLDRSADDDVRIRAFCVLLKSETARERIQRAEQLSAYGDRARPAVWPLMGLLSDKSTMVRYSGADALGEIGPTARDAVPELLRLVQGDPRHRVREHAALALGRIGADPERVIPEILRFVGHQVAFEEGLDCRRMDFARYGELGIVAFGPRAFPYLRRALEDQELRPAAYRVLAQFGPKPEPFLGKLIERVRLSDADLDRLAIVLRQIGAPAVPPLIALLTDRNSDIADRAEYALGEFGEEAIPALIQTLKHRDRKVCHRACRAVAASNRSVDMDSPHAPAAIAALVPFTKDSDAAIRATAVSTLGRISVDTCPEVLHALRDPDAAVRRAACAVLAQRRETPCAAVPLTACLGDVDPLVRLDAVTALWQLERRVDPVFPAATAALSHKNSEVRAAGIALLLLVYRDGDHQPMAALMPELQRMRWFDPDEDVRSTVEGIVKEFDKAQRH